jgi:hypothetical protein
MKFTFRSLSTTPDDLTESEVRICSSQFEELTGSKAFVSRLKPWKGRVVALTTKTGTIYRLVRGHGSLSIPAGICWLGPRTRSQLDVHPESELEIRMVPIQWLGRIFYYNSHLDDAVRFTFRIGFWGFMIGLIALLVSLISIAKPLF